MDQTLAKLLRPEVLIFLIPLVVVVGIAARKILTQLFEHKERMAKIEAGFDPDADDEPED